MMDIQEVADKLHGVQYGSEGKVLTLDFCKELRREGIVVVRGYSDDLIEFDGAISDELGAYDHYYFTAKGLVRNDCDDDRCPYFEKIMQEVMYYVKPQWCEIERYAWTYDSNIPHATFDVMEGTDKYCRGIVFKLSDME
jgi:hypothetical protein